LKLLDFLPECFVGRPATKQLAWPRNHFPLVVQISGNSDWLSSRQQDGATGSRPGDHLMRTLSFILAFAFVLAGPSMAGSSDNLPAAGAFAYNGAPAANSAPLVVAAK
jgi:hypothetical protein